MRERTAPFGGRRSSRESRSPRAHAEGPRTITYTPEYSLFVYKTTTTLTADPCAICQWWKAMNKTCMVTCSGVKDLCTLKYEFFKEWPDEMISHTDTAYMLFTCDTIDKYAHLLKIIFNIKFIERAIELKALIDNQLCLMKPHLSKIIGWYRYAPIEILQSYVVCSRI